MCVPTSPCHSASQRVDTVPKKEMDSRREFCSHHDLRRVCFVSAPGFIAFLLAGVLDLNYTKGLRWHRNGRMSPAPLTNSLDASGRNRRRSSREPSQFKGPDRLMQERELELALLSLFALTVSCKGQHSEAEVSSQNHAGMKGLPGAIDVERFAEVRVWSSKWL